MPQSTMRDEPLHKLPKDEPLHVALKSVVDDPIKWIVKDGPDKGKKKEKGQWKWEFEILAGEFAGLHVWGKTQDYISTHPDNLVRQWAEAITGASWDVGDGINTDDLLGIECVAVLDWTERERSDGKGTFYDEPVKEVYNLAMLADLASLATAGFSSGNSSDEPPF